MHSKIGLKAIERCLYFDNGNSNTEADEAEFSLLGELPEPSRRRRARSPYRPLVEVLKAQLVLRVQVLDGLNF